jgi:tetratricopeptide (TPR) repeat protein
MLAKPAAVVVPLIVAIIDLMMLRRPLPRVVLPCLLWLLLAVPVAYIAKESQQAGSLEFIPPWWGRLLVAADALAFYIGKLLVPYPLCIDYGRSPQWLWYSTQIFITWVTPILAGALAWQARKRAPYFLTALILFVISLAPILGFVTFDFQVYSTVTDHYLYLAMLAPAIITAFVLAHYPDLRTYTIAGIILVIFGALSFVQISYWRNSESLFTQAVKANPDSNAGNASLGNIEFDQAEALVRSGLIHEAQLQMGNAINKFEKALTSIPSDFATHRNVANAYRLLGHWKKAEEHYRAALALNPKFAEGYANLGTVLANQLKYDEAIPELEEAIRLDPNFPAVRQILIEVRKRLAQRQTTQPTSTKPTH